MHNPLFSGTILLTVAGLITRFIGFFYRIFLSNALGARLLGIYQLIFPVYGICYTLFASGLQTAISKKVAEYHNSSEPGQCIRYLKNGILLSVSIALSLGAALYCFSDRIAISFLNEAECTDSLRVLALAFPFCGVTACINGYCYGIRKSFLPASSQLTEQIVRVLVLYLIAGIAPVSCELAILALVAGEIASCLYSIFGVSLIRQRLPRLTSHRFPESHILHALLSFSAPLTANRLFISLLHSFESFLIPLTLQKYGMEHDEALRIFGIISGMTMSFLMFPGTLTNSLSVLLLPAVSEAQAAGQQKRLEKSIAVSIKYSILLGIFSGFYFFYFGPTLGTSVFGEVLAGTYLACLSFLCPFLYLATTLSSILNGFSQMNLTFLSSVLGLSLRLVLFAVLIPRHSVYGYFISLLISQLFLTFFDCFLVRRFARFPFSATDCIVKPALIMLGCTTFFHSIYRFLLPLTSLPALLLLAIVSIALALTALVLFFITGVCKRDELP
ncbi:MAG: polysaccharide biosynthesis protein [Lachnospiraceae bacterium]|nr:polysaccharide biosynthesis protein [Lachnospiraceae bacterium]